MNIHNLRYYAERQPTPETGWLFANLLKRQNMGFIIGEAKKTYKSWLLFDLGWSLARGVAPWQQERFTPPSPGTCVYFALEDSEDDIHDRYRLLARTRPAGDGDERMHIVTKDTHILLADQTPHKSTEALKYIRDGLKPLGQIDLLIFDVLSSCHVVDENDAQQVGRLIYNAHMLADWCGSAVLFAHHTRKPGEIELDYSSPHNARGSSALWGAADLFITAAPEGDEHVKLHFHTKRCRTPRACRLHVNLGDGTIKETFERPKPDFQAH